jgi:hypothetical protein
MSTMNALGVAIWGMFFVVSVIMYLGMRATDAHLRKVRRAAEQGDEADER